MAVMMEAHHSCGRLVFIVTTTTFALATAFVVARLISRYGILRTRSVDDWCIILAWVIASGLSISIDYGTTKGLGRYDIDIPAEWFPLLRRSEYFFTILYNPALMATKTSILIFYLRLSRNTQKAMRIGSFVTLAVVNVSGVVLTFLNAFQCNPPSAAFEPLKPTDRCMSIVTLYLCSAPVNIITDLAILILPIPVLTGMNLPQRQKSILVATFALGIFVTIVDVLRIYYLQRAVHSQEMENTGIRDEVDFARNVSPAFMWSAVEVNVGIICACIPTLKPLVKRVLPAMIFGSEDEIETEDTSESPLQGSFNSTDAAAIAPAPAPATTKAAAAETRSGLPVEEISTLQPSTQTSAVSCDEEDRLEQQMDMMEFLTTPSGIAGDRVGDSTQTNFTQTTTKTIYFGFVNMRRPKSMLKTRGWESFKYCAIVTTLFFLWGFSYGLLNILNHAISQVANQSLPQTLGLNSAYFAAYLSGALTVGQWTLRRIGFKASFITGLCIYGTGTLMFWPSAVLVAYPGFIISNFVVGFGLAILETAANPFLALCGPPATSEFRLLLAQAVQAIATVLSELLAQKVLFDDVGSLIEIQWTYLAVALLTVILALFFYYMPLPEASDADLASQAAFLSMDGASQVVHPRLPWRLVPTTLGLAVMAQFAYVAAQEGLSFFYGDLLESLSTTTGPYPKGGLSLSISNYTLIAHSAFTISRFIFAALSLVIAPRILLLCSFCCSTILSIITTTLPVSANSIAIPAILLFFFEAPIFPLLFAIGLRGLGSHTKQGAVYLNVTTSGAAGMTWAMYAMQRPSGRSVQHSFSIVSGLFGLGFLFPIYLCLIPNARQHVDAKDDMDDLNPMRSIENPSDSSKFARVIRLKTRLLNSGLLKAQSSTSADKIFDKATQKHRKRCGDKTKAYDRKHWFGDHTINDLAS